MIPKIIHYCWLSKDKYPPKIEYCIKSWNKIIPEYKFILWDLEKCKEENILNNWVIEAFNNKKYAFASDYIRLYAVHKYGGIYLDTDVEIIKPFDELLHLPYFIGCEAVGNRVEIAAFGAEKDTKWIKLCMDYYIDKHFIKENGNFDMKVMPDIVHEIISSNYIIQNINSLKSFDISPNIFNQFPNDWFCANIYKNINDKKPSYSISKNTFCIHHFANTWLKDNRRRAKINIRIKNKMLRYVHKLCNGLKSIFQ